MEKMKLERSQLVAKIAVLFLFFLAIRFIAASLRPSWLYFLLINLLIAALAIESGILHALSEPSDHDMIKRPAGVITPPPPVVSSDHSAKISTAAAIMKAHEGSKEQQPSAKPVVVDVDKTGISLARVQKPRRCPSMPSLFFIGNSDHEVVEIVREDGEEDAEEEEEEVANISAQELLVRAEMFIANFYKQLKIQREASWNKIHGLYHNKPF